jgi:hypothetical protein
MKVGKHNALSGNTASGRTGSSIVWCESAVRNHRAINAPNTVISSKFSYQYERNSVSSPNGVRVTKRNRNNLFAHRYLV